MTNTKKRIVLRTLELYSMTQMKCVISNLYHYGLVRLLFCKLYGERTELRKCLLSSNVSYFTWTHAIFHTLDQGWPTQLHHWANIFVTIVKKAPKLLMENSISLKFFWWLFFGNLIFFPYACQKSIDPKSFFAISTKFTSFEKFFLPKKLFTAQKME